MGSDGIISGGNISGWSCGSLYPSLYLHQFGELRHIATSGRQVERMLKCSSCGTQYLLREAAETVDKSPLIALKCSGCTGNLEVMK